MRRADSWLVTALHLGLGELRASPRYRESNEYEKDKRETETTSCDDRNERQREDERETTATTTTTTTICVISDAARGDPIYKVLPTRQPDRISTTFPRTDILPPSTGSAIFLRHFFLIFIVHHWQINSRRCLRGNAFDSRGISKVQIRDGWRETVALFMSTIRTTCSPNTVHCVWPFSRCPRNDSPSLRDSLQRSIQILDP